MKALMINHKSVNSDTAPNKELKWSIWNDIIDIDDSRVVIFNTLARNAILVKREILNTIPAGQEYVSLGYLVNADKDEVSDWEESFCSAKADMAYLDLTILLTHQCQMKCQYCFEGDKESTSISNNSMEEIMNFLKAHKDTCNRLRVTWFGGEPLLNYPKLKDMSMRLIEFCRENEIQYSGDITTNAFALTSERCSEMVNELNVKRFIITLDGPAEVHDRRRPLRSGKPTFYRIWRNIGHLIDAGGQVTIRMTIDSENAPSIPELLNKIAASSYAGKVGISFCRTIDYNFTPDHIRPLLYSEKEFADVEWELIKTAHSLGLYRYSFPHAAPKGGCLRKGDVVVGSDGVVYKCLDTVGDKRWALTSIDKIDLPSETPHWHKEWCDWTPSQSPSCSKCTLRPLCNGGCPHNALFRDKKHGSNLQCPDWKPNYRRQIIELVKENDQAI